MLSFRPVLCEEATMNDALAEYELLPIPGRTALTSKVSLDSKNGGDALRDAYEIAFDLCVYLRQAIIDRDDAMAQERAAQL